MNELILFIAAIILHEAGHYFFGWIHNKQRPKIKFNWNGFLINVGEDEKFYSLKYKSMNHLVGVIAGLIPLMIFDVSERLFLIYIIICSIDLISVWSIFEVRKKYNMSWGANINDIPCDRCKKLGLHNNKQGGADGVLRDSTETIRQS